MATKKENSLRDLPLVHPVVYGRATGRSPHVVERAIADLGIRPHRPARSAKKLISLAQCEQIDAYLRDAR